MEGDSIKEEFYDDVFLCISNIFIISTLAFAMKEKGSNPSYKFCIISMTVPKEYELKSITDFGGCVFQEADLAARKIGCETINLHSFGYAEWQRSIIEKISYNKRGVYTDAIKNGFPCDVFGDISPLTRRIYFGFVLQRKNIGDPYAHVVECSYYFNAFEFCKSRSQDLQNLEQISAIDEELNLVFLRYWGGGPYTFKVGCELKTAVLKSLDGTGFRKIHIKSDPRISIAQYNDTISYLMEAGYEVREFGDLFSIDNNIVNLMPAEFFLPRIKSPVINAIVYDSAISISLKYINNANIVFPDEASIEGIFEGDTARNTIMLYSKIYQDICLKMEESEDKDEVHIVSY
ncbi:MAG: hypothetical protein WC989_09660 [Micavibrio sp.]